MKVKDILKLPDPKSYGPQRIMTPVDCAKRWGITKKEVMMKIFNTLSISMIGKDNHENNYLPQDFRVRRLDSDNYILLVPKEYRFIRPLSE